MVLEVHNIQKNYPEQSSIMADWRQANCETESRSSINRQKLRMSSIQVAMIRMPMEFY